MRNFPALALLVVCAGAATVPPPPEQPLPFSHKVHADANMECKTCHPNPAPGKIMGIARPLACMQCHKTVKRDSPAVQKLATLAKKDRDVAWVRVYLNPSFIKFRHDSHLAAGYDCEECHGPVATRDQLFRERDISQIGCLACHRAQKIGLNCTFCHD